MTNAWLATLAIIASMAFRPLYADETAPLAGSIWDVAQARFVSFPEMLAAVKPKHFILIGERHGRDAHQGREAFLIKALAEAGRRPDVFFEMLDHSQSGTVKTYRQSAPEYAMGLAVPLQWAESNWPAWRYYEPVFDAAFTTKAAIYGADLTEAEQADVTRTASTQPQPSETQLSYYQDQMRKAHCGLIDDDKSRDLGQIQIARDRKMAETLTAQANREQGGILIVGASHVRRALGVPSYLPDTSRAIILLFDTDAPHSAFQAAQGSDLIDDPASYDFIWFTPKTDERSFCDRLSATP